MAKSPFDDFLKDMEKKGTPDTGGTPKKKRKKQDLSLMSSGLVDIMEITCAATRELLRPLTEKEKTRLARLIDEAHSCAPENDDLLAITRFLSTVDMGMLDVDDEEEEEPETSPEKAAFSLGMAYERLQAKGWGT